MFSTLKGWGRSTTGYSLTPFDSRQTTIHRSNPHLGLRPELPHTLPPCNPREGASKPRVWFKFAKPHPRRPRRDLDLNDPQAFRQIICQGVQPSGKTCEDAGDRRLAMVLDCIAKKISTPGCHTEAGGVHDLNAIPMLALSHAVNTVATEQNLDSEAVARALNVLQQIDFQREVLEMCAPLPRLPIPVREAGARAPAAGDADEQAAWRIAYRLGSSIEGLRILETICARNAANPVPERGKNETDATESEANKLLLTFMTACDAIANDRKTAVKVSSLVPADLLGNISAQQDTRPLHLLEKAILALGARFAQLDNPLREFVQVPYAWAITAVDNGFFTEKSMREPAKRLEKLATKWVDRATSKQQPENWLDGAKTRRRFHFSLLNPQKKKSPFHALCRTGARKPIDFGIAGQSGLSGNRAIAAALAEMIGALESNERPSASIHARPAGLKKPLQHPLPPSSRVTNAARLEILKAWNTQDQFLHLTDEKRLAAPAVEVVKAAVSKRLGFDAPGPHGLQTARQALVTDAVTRENRRLCPPDLIETAANIPGCNVERIRTLLNPPAGFRPEHAGAPALTQKNFNRENLRNALCTLVDEMDKGCRLNLSSGGVWGIGTKGLSATVSGLSSASLIRSRLDLRYEKSKQAICEIGVMTHGVEMLLGTQTVTKKQCGVGIFGGLGLLSFLTAGLGNDTSIAREVSLSKSILLRLARPKGGVAEMKRTASEFKDVIRTLLQNPDQAYAPDCPPDERNLLVELFKRYPDLSIGQKASSTTPNRTTSLKTSLIAGTFAKFGIYRAGISATAEAEHRIFHRYEYGEGRGRIRLARFTRGSASRINVAFGGNAASFAIPIPGYGERPDGRSLIDGGGSDAIRWTLGTPNLDVLHWNADIYQRGLAMRANLISEAGKIGERSTCVRMHTNAAGFVRTIRANLEYWTDSMARRCRPAAYRQGGREKEFALGQERAKILQFLDLISETAQSSHLFHEQMEIKPAVARKLTSLYELVRQAGRSPVAESYRDEIRALVEAEDSWQPAHLIVYDGAMSQGGWRIDLVGKAAAQHNKGSTRIVRMI